MGLSTHVLDTSIGKPAEGVGISLERMTTTGGFEHVRDATTDADGRVKGLLESPMLPGVYRLTFDTHGYFGLRNLKCFYPKVAIEFELAGPNEHYHVPLLVSPYGYSTYRGS